MRDEPSTAEEFIERNWSAMLRLAKAELREKNCVDTDDHALDVAGDVSANIVRRWNEIRSPENAIFALIARRARSHARACRREVPKEIDERTVPLFSAEITDTEQILESALLIERVLSLLTEEEADVVVKRYYLDMAFTSKAEQSGKPLGTITSIHSRALNKIRTVMERDIKPSPAEPRLGRARIQEAVRSIVRGKDSTEKPLPK